MCVAFIAISGRTADADASNATARDNVQLVIAFNRDEDYERPTSSVRTWSDTARDGTENIVGARDDLGGGTWMAVCKRTGRWALLTNATDGSGAKGETKTTNESSSGVNRARVTRGELVTTYLRRDVDGEAYALEVFAKRFNYDGFNLVVGDSTRRSAFWVGNRGSANAKTPMKLMEGRVYGLANDVLDTPWPKVVRGKAKMEEILRAFTELAPEARGTRALEERILRDVLHAPVESAHPVSRTSASTRVVVGPASLSRPRRISDIEVDSDRIEVDCSDDEEEYMDLPVEQIEPHESESSFVRPGELPGRPNCGTRTSQVVVVSADGRCSWLEHHFVPNVEKPKRGDLFYSPVVAQDHERCEFAFAARGAAAGAA